MAPIHVLAIITPKPDRVARIEQLAKEVASGVEATEPGVLKYQWFKTGTPEEPRIVVWEVYADEAAVNVHKSGSKLAWLIETEKKEGNFAAPLEVLPLQQFAGWAAREGAKI
ncbi:hypothetical protein NEMBOFW57_007108 [Staphylotrichum longicolle]|uniref:ABM domain-containing protein n=1 Tax=Staphylotrichum longicolle TaxID=669026 RepID=A0AAD4HY49_9PEZI|nr:hypothetical protein NEMBOFW57_007108 [Staphylotrichum longicolle]